MGTMIVGSTCGELAVVLLILTVDNSLEISLRSLIRVSEPELLGSRTKKAGGHKHSQVDGNNGHFRNAGITIAY